MPKHDFETYYGALFEEHPAWGNFEAFMNALQEPTRPILRFRSEDEASLRSIWASEGLTWKTLSWCPQALVWPPERELGEELPGYAERLFYVQNASSLLPVLALDPLPGETVLDACAAPGGKTLFIADRMGLPQTQKPSRLIANDLSATRRGRLKQVLKEYGVVDSAQVMGRNALGFGASHPEYFDRILLDAPCSSEKHVANDSKALRQWKPGRIRHLRQRQFKLLKSLFKALKPGGRLVYSTCAVNGDENEGVVERFLTKFGARVGLVPFSVEGLSDGPDQGHPLSVEEFSSSFNSGTLRILPHQYPGMDPMFVAIFEKSNSTLND